jgi:hypothetical protein
MICLTHRTARPAAAMSSSPPRFHAGPDQQTPADR